MESENENGFKEFYMWVKWFAFLVVAFVSMPLLINSGAMGPLTLLVPYWGLLYLQKRHRANPSKGGMVILLQKLENGKIAAYDYYSLTRVTEKEYWSFQTAQDQINNLYPGAAFRLSS